MPRELNARGVWLDQYIRNARNEGTLSRVETTRALKELNLIRSRERSMYHNREGELSVRDEAAIQVRFDRLSDRLRISRADGRI